MWVNVVEIWLKKVLRGHVCARALHAQAIYARKLRTRGHRRAKNSQSVHDQPRPPLKKNLYVANESGDKGNTKVIRKLLARKYRGD